MEKGEEKRMSAIVEAKEVEKLREQILEKVDARMSEIAQAILNKAIENLQAQGTSDTKKLLNSGNVVENFLRKEVVFNSPYASAVEFGTHAHVVPASELVGWVRRKLAKNEKEAWSIAYAISKKISKVGTAPQPFLIPAMEFVKITFRGVKT